MNIPNLMLFATKLFIVPRPDGQFPVSKLHFSFSPEIRFLYWFSARESFVVVLNKLAVHLYTLAECLRKFIRFSIWVMSFFARKVRGFLLLFSRPSTTWQSYVMRTLQTWCGSKCIIDDVKTSHQCLITLFNPESSQIRFKFVKRAVFNRHSPSDTLFVPFSAESAFLIHSANFLMKIYWSQINHTPDSSGLKLHPLLTFSFSLSL